MKTLLLLLALAPSASAARPRLAVVLVVDQMRGDYLERDPEFTGGFKRLAREGAWFTDAHHRHLPTETGPGHAAISTGRGPAEHGIVGNDWHDRRRGKDVYCVGDEPYGIGPGRLQGPTLADALKAADPGSRVFSLSSKDRAAVLLGGRKAELALWFDRNAGEWTTSSYYRRPSWLDAFNARMKSSGKLAPVKGRVPSETLASPQLDEVTAELAAELLRREKIGAGPGTDLLMISFSGTDTTGHSHGIDGPEMKEQLRRLDALIGEQWKLWEKASAGALVLAFTGDHGAIPAEHDESGRAAGVKRYDWAEFDKAMEAALQALWPEPQGKWVTSNQLPHVYLNLAQARRWGLERREFLKEAARALSGLRGVARALTLEEGINAPDSDPLAPVFRNSLRPGSSGDLLVLAEENALLHGKPRGTSHGTHYRYDTHVPLVFWGKGVKAGRHEAPASVQDLAPTMGRLLELDYPPAPGAAARAEALAEAR